MAIKMFLVLWEDPEYLPEHHAVCYTHFNENKSPWPIIRKIFRLANVKYNYEYRHYLTAASSTTSDIPNVFLKGFRPLLVRVPQFLQNIFFYHRDFLLSWFVFVFIYSFHKNCLIFFYFLSNEGLTPQTYFWALAPDSAKTLLNKYLLDWCTQI